MSQSIFHFECFFPRFVGLSDSLPKTSNIKMVDIWMLFSLVLPFIDVVLQTYSYLLTQGEEEEERKGEGQGRVRVGITTLSVPSKKALNKRYCTIIVTAGVCALLN